MTSRITDAHLRIQETLESSTPLLNELKFKKLFTGEEISELVRQRTDWEHKLRSTAQGGTPKSVYLKYLEMEMNFTSQVIGRARIYRRMVRQQQQQKERKNSKKEDKKTVIGEENENRLKYFSKQLVHVFSLFEKALHHFPSDASLWRSFIDFTIQFNFRAAPAMERACKSQPNQVHLWIMNARWHFDYLHRPQQARSCVVLIYNIFSSIFNFL